MNISFIFFGEDAFSLVVLQSLVKSDLNLNPLAVVMLEPISRSGERLASYCNQHGIRLIKTSDVSSQEFIKLIEGCSFDILITAHFQKILPKVVFNGAKVGALNLHPSLLPKFRGMSPQHWPLIFNEQETGVSVHFIESDVDSGNIVKQVRIPLSPDIYIHQLQKKMLIVYQSIMLEAIKLLISGHRGSRQNIELGSYFHKIKSADMQISIEKGYRYAYGQIRAFSFPYDGASFGGLRIMRASPLNLIDCPDLTSQVGLIQHNSRLYLCFKDGVLELEKWKKYD
jgi:methionyl-tRNA formyltransferase